LRTQWQLHAQVAIAEQKNRILHLRVTGWVEGDECHDLMAGYTLIPPVIQDVKNRGSVVMITRGRIITGNGAVGGNDLLVGWSVWSSGICSPLLDHVSRASARAVAYDVILHHGPVVDLSFPVVMRWRSRRRFRRVFGELQCAGIVLGRPFA
jgi:hypothetical protein